MKSFRFRSITFIVATALAVQQTAAQVMCSCSPTVFDFVLNLDGSCGVNDIVDNSGIDGSFCFTEEVNTVPGRPDLSSSIEMIEEEDKWWLPIWKQYLEPVRERILQVRKRVLQSDPVTEIVSVLFLEFDTSGDLTVINQDDTYIDVSLGDGDPLTFNSVSSFLDTSLPLSEQMSNPALVPGGASMILYGKTASGAVFRNRFFWIYDMNCGRDNSPINVNDEIGWITVDEIASAWPAFCPALPAGSPTIPPRTNEPTLMPSGSPQQKPTIPPSMISLPTSAPTTVGKSGKSKSGKGTKSSKSDNSHSMSMSIRQVIEEFL